MRFFQKGVNVDKLQMRLRLGPHCGLVFAFAKCKSSGVSLDDKPRKVGKHRASFQPFERDLP
jgi:hypothetical protein